MLLIAIGFLAGGFMAISKFGKCPNAFPCGVLRDALPDLLPGSWSGMSFESFPVQS